MVILGFMRALCRGINANGARNKFNNGFDRCCRYPFHRNNSRVSFNVIDRSIDLFRMFSARSTSPRVSTLFVLDQSMASGSTGPTVDGIRRSNCHKSETPAGKDLILPRIDFPPTNFSSADLAPAGSPSLLRFAPAKWKISRLAESDKVPQPPTNCTECVNLLHRSCLHASWYIAIELPPHASTIILSIIELLHTQALKHSAIQHGSLHIGRGQADA